MANLTRNFTAGKMNKVVDERLVPNGEYIDALNVRMGSTEKSEIGVIENTKGNELLSQVLYLDGTPLSNQARCIGAFQDSANETLYWFVHDPNFVASPTGKLDIILSYNVFNTVTVYHVVSTDDGTGTQTTLNFDSQYPIIAINKVDDLLFFTDNYNQPRFINVKRSYPNPVLYIDQFSAESLLVVKKPPVSAPTFTMINSGSQENFLEDKFICFAYRYKYADNEYSATSQFSEPAFIPNAFNFSADTLFNEGMTNAYNTAVVTYNTGGPLVKGIDLLFKETDNNVIRVIEKFDKDEMGLADNTDYTFSFSNSKIYTILPESELFRLYDNVPLKAKAQTVMGNRLMYGNYVEGYNLVDKDGFQTRLEFQPYLVSNEISIFSLTNAKDTGTYNIDTPPQSIAESIMTIDLSGASLTSGAALVIEFSFEHSSFSGDLPFPTETTNVISASFTFPFPRDYSSVYDLATSPEFQNAVGTILNIQSMANACNGFTLTDIVNCSVPSTLDALLKSGSGINSVGEPITIITSPSSTEIGFQIQAVEFVDNLATPTQTVYEYYKYNYIEAYVNGIANAQSLHSNRGYEVGIVYMDEFNRSTTALVSPNNTVNVTCSESEKQNQIYVTIPVSQIAPAWATRYKFVLKPDYDYYDTIYSRLYFKDPTSGSTYFLLEGENARKIEKGDNLIVKADSQGAVNTCMFTTVLDKTAEASNFISVPSTIDPTQDMYVPAGTYMKINANNFSAILDDQSIYSPGSESFTVTTSNGSAYPQVCYPLGWDISGTYTDVDIPAGSRINLNFDFVRKGTADGNSLCERRIYKFDKTFVSSANYSNFKDWWDGDGIENYLNQGNSEVGGGGCSITNNYDNTLVTVSACNTGASGFGDNCVNKFQFYRDTSNNLLSLSVIGTNRCTGLWRKDKRESTVTVAITIYRAVSTVVFETLPKPALPDVFYENEMSFAIDANGQHMGNVQDQVFGTGTPAIVNTQFFNCFSFGNGVESYKAKDSIIGHYFNLGNRVTTVASQDYKQAWRFADMTYSGVYNDETNVNKLNEFNLGLLNFKPLEDSFGQIQILDARQTDVLVLQEDKISYVLAGKNLLSDAAAGGAITSVPEVLGTQMARTEKYGISLNAESYVHWGQDRFFTDAKRGAVIQLKGDMASQDQLGVISEMGMRSWFRDLFNENFTTQKLGAFDPYLNEYVLTSNEQELPIPPSCVSCGMSQVFPFTNDVKEFTYCIDAGGSIGDVTITYEILSLGTGSEFKIDATYNGSTETSGFVTNSGTLTIDKNVATETTIQIELSVDFDEGPCVVAVNVSCPDAAELTIIEVVVTNDAEEGETIHAQYRSIDPNGNNSALQSALVTFQSTTGTYAISRYNQVTGSVGTGSFPANNYDVTMYSNQLAGDTFDFDPLEDRLRYLVSPIYYGNNQNDIDVLLSIAQDAVPITTQSNPFAGEVNRATFNVGSLSNYLYLIWDLRISNPETLCFSADSLYDVCCNCVPCEIPCQTWAVTALNCSSLDTYQLLGGSTTYIIMSPTTQTSGTLTLDFIGATLNRYFYGLVTDSVGGFPVPGDTYVIQYNFTTPTTRTMQLWFGQQGFGGVPSITIPSGTTSGTATITWGASTSGWFTIRVTNGTNMTTQMTMTVTPDCTQPVTYYDCDDLSPLTTYIAPGDTANICSATGYPPEGNITLELIEGCGCVE